MPSSCVTQALDQKSVSAIRDFRHARYAIEAAEVFVV
jgi:hypothetical protein